MPLPSGREWVSLTDPFKRFVEKFEGFITDTTSLSFNSVKKNVRLLRDVLQGQLLLDGLEASVITKNSILTAMSNVGRPNGKGYLEVKRRTCTANYARMMLDALRKALTFMMTTTDKEFHVSKDNAAGIKGCLEKLHSECFAEYILVLNYR